MEIRQRSSGGSPLQTSRISRRSRPRRSNTKKHLGAKEKGNNINYNGCCRIGSGHLFVDDVVSWNIPFCSLLIANTFTGITQESRHTLTRLQTGVQARTQLLPASVIPPRMASYAAPISLTYGANTRLSTRSPPTSTPPSPTPAK